MTSARDEVNPHFSLHVGNNSDVGIGRCDWPDVGRAHARKGSPNGCEGIEGGNGSMQYRMLAGKIHRARVTEANLNYIGSVTIDQELLQASGLLPYEMVQITNLANGALWQTYIIPGEAGQGDICLNGPPARLFQPEDLVVILGWRTLSDEELSTYCPRVVFVDDHNHPTKVIAEEKPFIEFPGQGL